MESYYYCPVCKKQMNSEETVRKPMDTMQKIVWAIIIVATLGVGGIVFLIYHYGVKEKIYCPVCSTKLTRSREPFEKEQKEEEEPKTPREKVMKKAGKEVPKKKKKAKEKKTSEEEKELFCPFCGTKLEAGTKVCPSCGTSIEDR